MMEALFIYLIKVSAIMGIFYLVYQIGLRNETFFTFNRHFLLSGIIAGFLLPLIKIPQYVEVTTRAVDFISVSPNYTEAITVPSNTIDWWQVLGILYMGIALWFAIKMIRELYYIASAIVNGNPEQKNGYYHIKLQNTSTPFSFFNYIFYNPSIYQKEELKGILEHEKAHSRQWHSLDILAARISGIVLWFNPFQPLYIKAIKQNLEFLADDRARKGIDSIESYQYTMLKASGVTVAPVIANQFYNSQIKKRIIMLHRSKSHQLQLIKSLLLIPALVLFLYSFNTYKIYVPANESNTIELLAKDRIKIVIDKNTTDKELKDLKKELKDKGYDFSYTVVHNDEDEITSIEIDLRSEKEGESFQTSTSFSNEGEPIDAVTIMIDGGKSIVFMGEGDEMQSHQGKGSNVWVHASDDDEKVEVEIKETDEGKQIWINGKESSEEDLKKMKKKMKKSKGDNVMIIKDKQEVEITEQDGKKVIKVNGKEVSEDEYKAMKTDKKHKARVWQDGKKGHKEEMRVEIKEKDGEKIIKVNGKEVSEEEYEKMEMGEGKNKKVIKIKRMGDEDDGENVMILKSGDGEEVDIEDIDIMGSDEDGFSFVFLNSDEQENMLYLVDGKESTSEAVKEMPTATIETVEILKGEKAVEKYGDKAKDGVVLVTTKKD